MNIDLHNSDCIETLQTLMADRVQIDAVLTDPPYCSCNRNGSGLSKYFEESTAAKMPPILCDDMSAHALLLQTRLWMRMATAILKPGGYFFCFADFRQLATFTDLMEQSGIKHRGVIVWDKGNARPQKGGFTQSTEFITWGTVGKPMSTKVLPGVYKIAPYPSAQRLHPTEKPVELLKNLLKMLPAGATVFEPFMGSGSTGQAALESGMNFIGCELSGVYFEIAKKRLDKTQIDRN